MSPEYKVNCVFKGKEGDNVITIDFDILANTIKDNEETVDFLFKFVRTFKLL